jgi:dihydroneopterin aldolase
MRIANAEMRVSHVFIRDLELDAHIGVHRHEKGVAQPVRINVDLTVLELTGDLEDKLAHVVDYEAIVDGIRAIVDGGHMNLVETLAERIASFALLNPRVSVARIRIEKLKAITGASSVGVEIERVRAESGT